MRKRIALVLATFFGCGYAPVASGTVGTAAALPLWWALSFAHPGWHAAAALALLAVGTWAAAEAGRHYGVVDSGRIVIDEVAGLLVTTLAVPFTPANVLAAFLAFRLFDITKPWPASYFDRKVKNGFGVVMDDIAAGVYARALLAALAALWPAVFAGPFGR